MTTVAPKRTRKAKPVTEAPPATDTLITRKLHEAVRALLDARSIAIAAGRADDARDIGTVISTLAHCGRRVDNRESLARKVVAFRPEVAPKFES